MRSLGASALLATAALVGCGPKALGAPKQPWVLHDLGLALDATHLVGARSCSPMTYEASANPPLARTGRSLTIEATDGECAAGRGVSPAASAASSRPVYDESAEEELAPDNRIDYRIVSFGGGSGGLEYTLHGCWSVHGQELAVVCRWQEEPLFAGPSPFCLHVLRTAVPRPKSAWPGPTVAAGPFEGTCSGTIPAPEPAP